MGCDDCNHITGHGEDCPKYNARQVLENLKGDIDAMQRLTSDGFEIRIFATSVEFVCEVKHPEQTEEFLGDSLLEIIKDVGEWVAHCDQGK